MSLETFTGWIKDLIAANPAGGDQKSQGDDHIRGIKQTLKAQFSGLTQGKAVTVNEDDLNAVPSTTLRANSCLPKNGSEYMTGMLVAPSASFGGIFGADGGVRVKRSGGVGAAYGLNMSSSSFTAGITVMQDNDAAQAWLVEVPRSAGGDGTDVRFSMPKPHYLVNYEPSVGADDTSIVTARWTRKNLTKTARAINAGAITLTTSAQELCRTGNLKSGASGQSLAHGYLMVNGGGSAATVTLRLEIWKTGPDTLLNTVDWQMSVQAGFSAIGQVPAEWNFSGETVYFRFLALSTAGGSVQGGKAFLEALVK